AGGRSAGDRARGGGRRGRGGTTQRSATGGRGRWGRGRWGERRARGACRGSGVAASTAGTVTRVAPAERLLDLLLALRHAPGRLTKADIRASVNGYLDATNDVAFERMFERDKDLLRHLGVPIVTDVDPVHEDAVGYRLDTAGY